MKRINRHLPRFLKLDILQNLTKVSLGKVGNSAFAFIVSILIARKLGVSDFGLFTLSLSVSIITLELVCSEGIDNGLVRFGALYLKNDPDRAALIFKVALKFKLIAICILFLLLLIFSKPLLLLLTDKQEFKNVILFGFIAGCCASLWRYILAILQSYERFATYALINIIPNLFKMLIIIVLIIADSLTFIIALALNVFGLFLGIIVGFVFMPKNIFPAKGDQKNVGWQLFHFAKWIVITNLIFALYSRLDIIMLTCFKGAFWMGIYSAALNFISALELIYISILTSFLPHVSKFTQRTEFISHIKKSLLISLVLATLISPLYIFAKPLILIAYSETFSDSILIFRILLIGSLSVLICNPLLVILYAKNKPQVLTFIFFILFSFNFCFNLIFIPKFGVIGAASVVTAGKVIGGLLIFYFSLKEVFMVKIPA